MSQTFSLSFLASSASLIFKSFSADFSCSSFSFRLGFFELIPGGSSSKSSNAIYCSNILFFIYCFSSCNNFYYSVGNTFQISSSVVSGFPVVSSIFSATSCVVEISPLVIAFTALNFNLPKFLEFESGPVTLSASSYEIFFGVSISCVLFNTSCLSWNSALSFVFSASSVSTLDSFFCEQVSSSFLSSVSFTFPLIPGSSSSSSYSLIETGCPPVDSPLFSTFYPQADLIRSTATPSLINTVLIGSSFQVDDQLFTFRSTVPEICFPFQNVPLNKDPFSIKTPSPLNSLLRNSPMQTAPLFAINAPLPCLKPLLVNPRQIPDSVISVSI
ncbi:Hypothetical_protein [Hexamita inflata]|uniref:Hypothetical_protein n=1 Tax=Hexamita inflata TaxID=28002 RepID=A0ABP1H8G9_9EUKA